MLLSTSVGYTVIGMRRLAPLTKGKARKVRPPGITFPLENTQNNPARRRELQPSFNRHIDVPFPERPAMDYAFRFLAGGVIVSLFAVLGDVLRPKSFAGLFGAAPSVALATLPLGFWTKGAAYVGIEARSMVLGALALAIYSVIVCQILMRLRWSALAATSTATVAWFVIAIGLKQFVMG